jgi:hypothetical protein
VTHSTRALAVGALLLVTSAGGSSAFHPRVVTRQLTLTLRDSGITPQRNELGKGRVAITVLNRSKARHDLVVMEDGGAKHVIGVISGVEPAGSRSKTLKLKPGGYLLLGARMRAKLVVRGQR